MSYKEMSKRLAELEAGDDARRTRVQTRVLERMTDGDVVTFGAFVARWEADHDAVPTPAEWDVLEQANRLVHDDPEARPSDDLGLTREAPRELP